MHPAEALVSDRAEFLHGTPIFHGLDRECLESLARNMDEVTVEHDAFLFHQGEKSDAMYVLREGQLVVLAAAKHGEQHAVAKIEPGECVGEGALIMAGGRSGSVRATRRSTLLRIGAPAFEAVMAAHPVLRHVLNGLVAARLPGLVDASLQAEVRGELSRVRLARGEMLFHADDRGDAVYVVVRGRLGAFRPGPDGEDLVAEIGAGEPVGEIALLTNEPRSLTVRALRESDLVRLSADGFDRVLAKNPQAIVPVARTLAERLRAMSTTQEHKRIRTVALLPLSADVPLGDLLVPLQGGLKAVGAVVTLGAADAEAMLGAPLASAAADSTLSLSLADWLDREEGGHDFSIFRCDPALTPWTIACVGRADRVLIVGRGADVPSLGPFKDLVDDCPTSAKELVLLHEVSTRLPSGTAPWLRLVRPSRHHHVRRDRTEDAERVARFLTGHAVGVVFGGGGARGYAHAGVVRALLEAGVTMDFLGGVSMGSMPAANLAMGGGYDEVMRAFHRVFVLPNRPFKPYTFPYLSIFNSRKAERALQVIYRDTQIEDLWINYFCVATDITAGEVKIFREGLLRRAIRASGSFPALFPPVPLNGHLLVDGGLFTNLPVEQMQHLCPGPILASDVSKDTEIDVDPALVQAPPLRQILWSAMNPLTSRNTFPGLGTVLHRAIDAREAGQRAHLRRSAAFCFTPPVGHFALDALQSLEEIATIGYHHAREAMPELPGSIARTSAPRHQGGQ